MTRFKNKSILVTGGSGGIGKATALQIAEEGGRVLVTGTNQTKLDEVQAAHANIKAVKNDAGDPQAAQVLAETVKQHFGELDAAFLNAGFGKFAPHTEVSAELFDEQYRVNVRGPDSTRKNHLPARQRWWQPAGDNFSRDVPGDAGWCSLQFDQRGRCGPWCESSPRN